MITVEYLTISDGRGRPILDRVNVSLAAGSRLGIVGESGSGKTTLAQALLGAVAPGLRHTGSVRFDGDDVMALRGRSLRRFRRHRIAYLPQDPASTLTPTMRVRRQLTELAADTSIGAVKRRLREVGLPHTDQFTRRYPHELSGGQRQRLALARVIATDPTVIVLDEPTTGLDILAQNLVLELVDDLVRSRRLGLVFITHNLSAASRMVDDLAVMRTGRIVETGPVKTVLSEPSEPYTRQLIDAIPRLDATATEPDTTATPTALTVTDLQAFHGSGRARVPVITGLTFSVHRGECVALLGESGGGKTTVARSIYGVHTDFTGEIRIDGAPIAKRMRDRPMSQRSRIQLVPQDATGSLNPRHTIGAAISAPLRAFHGHTGTRLGTEVEQLIDLVRLPGDVLNRRPGQLSGGQIQRVAIARALACRPDVLLCDEMTSNLDFHVQDEILALIDRIRRDTSLAILLITHDLGVIAQMAGRTLVLNDGQLCEQGPTSTVLSNPDHPWTGYLLAENQLPAPRSAERNPAIPRQRPTETEPLMRTID
ncbi:peptide/nickel transport system ATP-binding protein [Stackebrandtia endophytica]|uniref:Peptide/nickel transport system ATP-binding protein n=1 Tax=Stackebrandtia endophytica TaxID=1496996 RepID=A0A543ARX2_9ACTN|nr:ABC transporter ATP-binding protein [Stackebrandtia endophytica]TQL75332.1 peptide/nickel transport system ATP-binding protein [Stackebrandtia endophytica]